MFLLVKLHRVRICVFFQYIIFNNISILTKDFLFGRFTFVRYHIALRKHVKIYIRDVAPLTANLFCMTATMIP